MKVIDMREPQQPRVDCGIACKRGFLSHVATIVLDAVHGIFCFFTWGGL